MFFKSLFAEQNGSAKKTVPQLTGQLTRFFSPAFGEKNFNDITGKIRQEHLMGFCTLPRCLVAPQYHVTHKDLLNKDRWVEMMDVAGQIPVEFDSPNAVKQFFMRMGMDSRSDDTYEMYLEGENLNCDYCVQVSMAEEQKDAPFIRILAFAKEVSG